MAEEKPAGEDRVTERLDRIDARLERIESRLERQGEDTAELKGGFSQMDKRVSSLESLQRWAIGLVVTSLFALVGLILTVISRLP